MPVIRDLSNPAVRHPILDELATVVKDNKLDDPNTIMGVGAPRLPVGSMLKQELLKRFMSGSPWNPEETMGKGLFQNFLTVAGRKGANMVERSFPATKPYIEHPIDSLMQLFQGKQ